jgi:hypothetical protein
MTDPKLSSHKDHKNSLFNSLEKYRISFILKLEFQKAKKKILLKTIAQNLGQFLRIFKLEKCLKNTSIPLKFGIETYEILKIAEKDIMFTMLLWNNIVKNTPDPSSSTAGAFLKDIDLYDMYEKYKVVKEGFDYVPIENQSQIDIQLKLIEEESCKTKVILVNSLKNFENISQTIVKNYGSKSIFDAMQELKKKVANNTCYFYSPMTNILKHNEQISHLIDSNLVANTLQNKSLQFNSNIGFVESKQNLNLNDNEKCCEIVVKEETNANEQ